MKAHFYIFALADWLAVMAVPALADVPVLPSTGFSASRYEVLWTKSPFAVATAEVAPESADYAMVGIAQFDGVDYVNLIGKKSGEHILVTSGKPVGGFTLISITRGHTPGDTVAVFQKGGESLSLKLDQASAAGMIAANRSPGVTPNMGAIVSNQMGGNGPSPVGQVAANGYSGAAPTAGAFPSTMMAGNGSSTAGQPGATGFPNAGNNNAAFPSTMVTGNGSSSVDQAAGNDSSSTSAVATSFPSTSGTQGHVRQNPAITDNPPPTWTGRVPARVLEGLRLQ